MNGHETAHPLQQNTVVQPNTVVHRIFEAMYKRGITQKELSVKLGISEAAISKWKKSDGISSRSYTKYIKQLCEILQVSDGYILEGTGEIEDFIPDGRVYTVRTERMIRFFEDLSEDEQDYLLNVVEGFCKVVKSSS